MKLFLGGTSKSTGYLCLLSLAACALLLPLPLAAGFIVTPTTTTTTTTARINQDRFSYSSSTTSSTRQSASVEDVTSQVSASTTSRSTAISAALVETMKSAASQESARAWVDMMFGFEEDEETQQAASLAGFYALFEGIRKTPDVQLGLRGTPFVLSKTDMETALGGTGKSLDGFFSWNDLEAAVNDPYTFLEAGRGTTDNRKGWKMATVSNMQGQTYDEKRLTWDQVQAALEQGTVVLNSAGAHIPRLAGPCLACLDATAFPNALNCYITAPNMRTSAPPHTDKQDVVVVQTSGKKHWRVYSPPDPARNTNADMFARGKGDDNLPLHALQATDGFGCELLLDTILEDGDVLFIPAAFPHTTDTVQCNSSSSSSSDASQTEADETASIHLTFGLDSRIWDLDYLGLRRWALRRSQIKDTKLGQLDVVDNKNLGPVNLLPTETLRNLHEALPMGFLDLDNMDADGQTAEARANHVSSELERISNEVEATIASNIGTSVYQETTTRLQQYGHQVLTIHRDMYLAAIQEGRTRNLELAMTAHIKGDTSTSTNNLDQDRLSVIRVQGFFGKFEALGNELVQWAFSATSVATTTVTEGSSVSTAALPADWAFTLPIHVGDHVEADLGGAFFPARVSAIKGNLYDVVFFDGDSDTGMDRSMLKLLKPPAPQGDDEDTSGMTPKQLKRLKKQQEKDKKK